MQKAALIFNPVSGQGNAAIDLELILARLGHYYAIQVYETTPDCDGDVLAQAALKDGATTIWAAGGDGTVSLAAASIAGTGIPFGILSRGTANGLANALGLPTNLEQACAVIRAGHTRGIDLARCTVTTEDGGSHERGMVLLAGIGFEAAVVEQADRTAKDRWGTLAYIWSGFQQLRQIETFTITLELADRRITTPATALTIANAAPATSILAQGPAGVIFDDGLLDVTIVASETRLSAIAASYALLRSALRGEAADQPGIGYLRTPTLTVEADPPQQVVIDGEVVGYTPLSCTCVAQGLIVLCPASVLPTPAENLSGLPEVAIESLTVDESAIESGVEFEAQASDSQPDGAG